MKHLIILFALVMAGCAAHSIKCPVNSLPPSPTHEELIKQERHNAFVIELDKAAQKHIDNMNASLRAQGLDTASINKTSVTVVDGSEEPLGVVEIVLFNRTQKIGYLYYIFVWVADEWEFRYSVPILSTEEEMGI